MEEMIQDLRYAVRGLARSPGLTVVAALTLALGVGVNATIFSVVNAVLLRPLPVEDPERLVEVYSGSSQSPHETSSYPDYLDLRGASRTLDGLVAFSNFFASYSDQAQPEMVIGEAVSDNYFEVMGIQPSLGRPFRPEEFVTEGAGPVVILGHSFWQSRFGADPEVLGSTLRLNGTSYEVIGVAPASFIGMFPAVGAQMWIPISMIEDVEPVGLQTSLPSPTGDTRLGRRGQRWLWMRGRLAPGATVEQAAAELRGLMAGLVEQHPISNEEIAVTVLPVSGVRFNPALDAVLTPIALLVLGIVALLLLVACANIANMLLARAQVRRKEIAIRLAIGAGRGRIVRQLLTESIVLAVVGSAVGLLFTVWVTRVLSTIRTPIPVALEFDLGVDPTVVGFAAALALGTGIVFGLLPALQTARPELVGDLKESGSGSGRRGRRFELRDGLVVLQVAVSLVLLVAAALLARSLRSAAEIDVGFDPERLAYLALGVEMSGYTEQDGARVFVEGRRRLEALPEVEAATIVTRIPFDLNRVTQSLLVQDVHDSPGDSGITTDVTYADIGYAATMGIPVLRGRSFEEADLVGGRRVVMVNDAFASNHWPDGDAIGKWIRRRWDSPPHEVVGVIGDHNVNTVGEGPTPFVVFPMDRDAMPYGIFLARTRGTAQDALQRLRGEILAIDPELVFLNVAPLEDAVAISLLPVRLGAYLISAFGGLALALAAVGLYGVVGYSVSRRTREIGVRIALGAESRRVLGLVVGRGMALVAVGAMLGLMLAALGVRTLTGVLYGISALDPPSFFAAAGLLGLVGLVANLVPARRATRIDPMLVMRSE